MHESGLAQIVIVLAFAATLWRFSRTLPVQNVLVCTVLIMLISGVLQIIGERTGAPFGPYFYTEILGYLVLHLLPWPVPLIWVIVLLNSRGVARLILKPWRDAANYGIWSLALTCLLAVLFDAALEPFAARANHWWVWLIVRNIPDWYGALWVNFAGWAATSLLILGIITPWLINKKPTGEPPPDYHPLVIWVSLILLLALGNATHHLWAGVVFSFATAIFVTCFAWQNSRG